LEIHDDFIRPITKAYNGVGDQICSEGEKVVESKIKDNNDFKYTKVVVERPLLDAKGNPVLKKGYFEPDPALRDTESIPWKEDIQTYMAANVVPFAPDAWIDEKKSKIGYEIPFTREFYKYVTPRSSDEIYTALKDLEARESELMTKLLK